MLFRAFLFGFLGSFIVQLKSSTNTQVKHCWVLTSIHCFYLLFWIFAPYILAPGSALDFKFYFLSPVRLSKVPLGLLSLSSVLLPRFLTFHLHQKCRNALSRKAAHRTYQLTSLLLSYLLLSEMYAPSVLAFEMLSDAFKQGFVFFVFFFFIQIKNFSVKYWSVKSYYVTAGVEALLSPIQN